jgi:monoamine oxidase
MEYFDIVIVGAGFAGLSAAKYFSSKSFKCLIIEGRSRVGGRTFSQKLNEENSIIDLGGQWIGTNQYRILSLIKEFNLQLIEQTWHQTDPNHLGQHIGLKSLNDYQLEQINQINSEWDEMALELANVEHALANTKCSLWDQISLEEYIEEYPLSLDLRVKQELKLQILTLTGKFIFSFHLKLSFYFSSM